MQLTEHDGPNTPPLHFRDDAHLLQAVMLFVAVRLKPAKHKSDQIPASERGNSKEPGRPHDIGNPPTGAWRRPDLVPRIPSKGLNEDVGRCVEVILTERLHCNFIVRPIYHIDFTSVPSER